MKVGIVGGSGYTGGELIRLLSIHPEVEISWITSEKYENRFVSDVHPNLRNSVDIKFTRFSLNNVEKIDLIFLCLPHKVSMSLVKKIFRKVKIIDLSADFRIKDKNIYEKYYKKHECPEILSYAVYGLPEIHKEEIADASLVANPGCNSTAVILSLYPLKDIVKKSKVLIDVKEGSSAGGRNPSLSNIHAERINTVRVYKPKNHRHIAEIKQELDSENISMSAYAVGMGRGVFASSYILTDNTMDEKELWRIYREFYSNKPFVRIVKRKSPPYNYPDIKSVVYSNFCEIGFTVDEEFKRIIIFSALDNLIKGAAGQAVQNMNIMFGLEETMGLKTPGFYL